MPELPEVETIRRSLLPRLPGARLERVDVLSAPHWVNPASVDLQGQTLQRIDRLGKYLLFYFEHDGLLVHFRMTGKLLIRDEAEPETLLHTRWISNWTDALQKPLRLDFQDTRGFGGARVVPEQNFHELPSIRKLGPDALTGDYTPESFAREAKRHPRLTCKGLLLDQTVLSGLGNIYADELLFRAGIRPQRRCGRTSLQRLEHLGSLIRPILEEAIGLGGTSFRDYVDSFGKKGVFALKLNVYGRTGEPCHRCGTPIRRIQVAGRSTHFCPECQS